MLFSPQDNCAQEIVSAIDKAEQYVFIAMYFFTSRPIAQALIRSQDRGVEVKICLDDEQPHYEYSIIESEEIAHVYKEQFLKYWQGSYVDTCVYKDENRLEKTPVVEGSDASEIKAVTENKYVGSINSNIFHYPNCKWAKKIKEENKVWFKSRKEALDKGYTPCKVCNP